MARAFPLRPVDEVALRVLHISSGQTVDSNISIGDLEVLDQTLLPHEEKWLRIGSAKDMWSAIHRLSVRGAPLIGVAASLQVARMAASGFYSLSELRAACVYLRTARPTAVNLMHCLDAITSGPLAGVVAIEDLKVDESRSVAGARAEAEDSPETLAVRRRVVDMAYDFLERERTMCDNMAAFGAALVEPNSALLTHCNTGGLAVPGVGTALGVIRAAHAAGKVRLVYVDETRPLLQGGRLTAYELQREGIPFEILCDGASGALMRAGKVQRCFVGADRIAANGDFANKIGTYNVAVVAAYHKVPFHPVAPVSTVDIACATGDDIVIEQRDAAEVRGFRDVVEWAPAGARAFNPAFDVTPAELVTSLVLDTGVLTREMLTSGALSNLQQFKNLVGLQHE